MPVRLSGQDSRRGTFNQRHSVLIDIENETEYVPLAAPRRRPGALSRSTTRRSPKPRCSASNTATAATIPRRWCSGRRSSATSPTARRSSSTSSSPPAKTSGTCSPASCCCCRTATKARGRSTRARASSASCNSRPRTTCRSASPRPRRSTSTCCAGRRLRPWRKPLIVFTPKSMLRHPDAVVAARGLRAPALPAR